MKNINVQQQSHNSIISSINPLENQQVHSYRCQKGLKILWSDFFVAKYCALCNLKVDLNPQLFLYGRLIFQFFYQLLRKFDIMNP